jgi:hypothetical protein
MSESTEPIVGTSDLEYEPWIDVPDQGVKMRRSVEYLVLEDHWVPRGLVLMTTSQEPQIYFEVLVGPSGPRLIEFAFISRDDDSSGIRQADFREVLVSAIVEDFVAMWTFRMDRDDVGQIVRAATIYDDRAGLTRFVGRMRMSRTSRNITPQLLERVAKVYRENIGGHPTKAVEHHFQVSQRMAAEYVSRARQRGLLPPTKRGKKNA